MGTGMDGGVGGSAPARAPEVLFVSMAFPPLAFPRSVQVARLAEALSWPVGVLAAENAVAPRDETIAPGIEKRLRFLHRIPFRRPAWLWYVDRAAQRFRLPWARFPDEYRGWVRSAWTRYLELRRRGYRPDVLVTFGAPMSGHLFGLWEKRERETLWIAYFSDPWVGNPYHRLDPLSLAWNRRLERKVVEGADVLLFPSEEMRQAVMDGYAVEEAKKSDVLPHIAPVFPAREPREGYRIRVVGRFYGLRTPLPFLDALRETEKEEPDLLDGVEVELIGDLGRHAKAVAARLKESAGLSRRFTPVGECPHAETMKRIAGADALVLIDAPMATSVFFPSKLAEFFASGRFVLALSPPGPAARAVREAGGLVADVSDPEAVRKAVRRLLSERPRRLPSPPDIHRPDRVAARFQEKISALLTKNVSLAP